MRSQGSTANDCRSIDTLLGWEGKIFIAMIENICREGLLLIWESKSLAEFGRNSGPGRLVSSGRTRILDPFLCFDKRLLKAVFDAVNTPTLKEEGGGKKMISLGPTGLPHSSGPWSLDTSVFSAFV